MNMRARSVACLLPLFLTGCLHFHKAQNQQYHYLAPSNDDVPKPLTLHPELAAAVWTIPEQPLKSDNAAALVPTPKPPTRHHHASKASQQAANAPPPVAAPAEQPSVSAIGQLSTGDPADERQETEGSLAATERGLNGLNRTLSDQEQKTAAQIREYLKQAREALIANDVDGASTLAAKAKVLLGELSK